MPDPILLGGLIGRRDWNDLAWEAFRPGVRIHWLYRIGDDGAAAALLRYEPGAAVPLHEHLGWEHILILAGAQSDGQNRYAEGTLMISAPGTRHAIDSEEEGCVALAIWQRQVRLVEAVDE